MHKRPSATIEMYETHLGTRVLESVEVDNHAVTLYTSDDIELGWDDEYGTEYVYEWNTKRRY